MKKQKLKKKYTKKSTYWLEKKYGKKHSHLSYEGTPLNPCGFVNTAKPLTPEEQLKEVTEKAKLEDSYHRGEVEGLCRALRLVLLER